MKKFKAIRLRSNDILNLLNLMQEDKNLKLDLVVSGCHLSNFHGYSYKLIEKDNFKIS